MSRKTSKGRGPQVLIWVSVLAALALSGFAIIWSSNKSKKPYEPPTTPVISSSVKASLDQFKGKVVILDFWATWCGPCRMEIPGFINLQKKYHDQGLEVVGVSLDPITPPQGNAASVGPFMQKFNINYTILMVKDPAATAGYDYSHGIPTTYIVDREGRIAKQHIGAIGESVFEEEIKQLL